MWRAVNRVIQIGGDLKNTPWISHIIVESCLPALGVAFLSSASIGPAYRPLANPAVLVLRGSSLWSKAGQHAIASLSLTRYTAERRTALQSVYQQFEQQIKRQVYNGTLRVTVSGVRSSQ
jgi:hypothetical protein